MGLVRTLGRLTARGTLLGLGLAAYGAWEAGAFTLRRVDLPVLPAGHGDLRVLHLSDLHLTPSQHRKQEWLRSLADLDPDLVINTGDSLAHQDAVPALVEALGPLLTKPGAFVLGSNDYFAPTFRNPLQYLLPDTGERKTTSAALPWHDLRLAFSEAGWLDLTNQQGDLEVAGTSLAFAGVDDPHLRYDQLEAVAGTADPDADLRIAVVHAPYLRVLDQFARDGYDVVFAGHTHGGQVCLPGVGALTTNCDLEPARAKGLHRHPAASQAGDPESTWLHVSAGIGTSPYTPFRIACRPEATLLTLTARA